MSNSRPLMASLEKLVDCVMSEPTVFLVGSGISRDYPSVLPSAKEMLRYITLPAVAPKECPDHELKKIAEALPELYYEALIEFTNRKAASLWKVLTFGQTKKELQHFNLGPNIGHMVLVYLAWLWRVPLITVNYDLMLEFAAYKMGLSPIVCHHKTPHGYVQASGQKEISIWKVHGSVDDINSIRTTLYTITSLDASLLDKIRWLFERYQSCLIGYSGRDIDLFPELLRFKFPSHAFWLGPNFDEQHRIYQCPDNFVMVKETSTNFARLLITHISEDNPFKKVLTTALEDMQKLKEKEIESIRENVKELGRQNALQLMNKLLPNNDPNRLLIHGLALANISEDENSLKASYDYLNQFLEQPNLEPWRRCRALIIQAHSLHELSRFIDSEECARKAFQIAKSNGLHEEQGHALAAIDTALCGQHLRLLGFCDKQKLKSIRTWQTIIKIIIDTIRIRLLCPYQLGEQSTASQIRARWAYLGHLSRVTSIIQGGLLSLVSNLPVLSTLLILSTLLKILIRRIFLTWWHYFEQKSKRSGYAVGVAIAHRQISRLSLATRGGEYIPNIEFYSLMSASEQALFAYDKGEYLLQKGEKSLSRREFQECLKYAKKAGNKVVMLRALIGLYYSGERVNIEEIKNILASIQGDAYRKVEGKLLHALRKGNRTS